MVENLACMGPIIENWIRHVIVVWALNMADTREESKATFFIC